MDKVHQTGPFRAERTTVDRMIRIAFDMENGCFGVFAPSPRLYINSPQPTEQYVQVLRVSRVRSNLYCRVSASACRGKAQRRCRGSCHTASADLKELPSADLHGSLLVSTLSHVVICFAVKAAKVQN
jgi:hypothetical protein